MRRACQWRAQYAYATPLPQGGAKVRSSAQGQHDVAVCLTNSVASAFVDVDQVRSSPLAAQSPNHPTGPGLRSVTEGSEASNVEKPQSEEHQKIVFLQAK